MIDANHGNPGYSNPGFIYLASASPRRRELLAQLGLEFEVVPVDVDESLSAGEAGVDYVQRLAGEKSRAAWSQKGGHGRAVLAADTAVVIDGLILGKPADESDAMRMLTQLSDRTHEVLTAVSVRDDSREVTELSCSSVTFREITHAEIGAYWRSGEPADKAGAYAIQGMGAMFIENLSGSYSGVMGLPLFETARLLNLFGYRFPISHAQ
jgi:septum formation protein